jgi:hypothetical protein
MMSAGCFFMSIFCTVKTLTWQHFQRQKQGELVGIEVSEEGSETVKTLPKSSKQSLKHKESLAAGLLEQVFTNGFAYYNDPRC